MSVTTSPYLKSVANSVTRLNVFGGSDVLKDGLVTAATQLLQ